MAITGNHIMHVLFSDYPGRNYPVAGPARKYSGSRISSDADRPVQTARKPDDLRASAYSITKAVIQRMTQGEGALGTPLIGQRVGYRSIIPSAYIIPPPGSLVSLTV